MGKRGIIKEKRGIRRMEKSYPSDITLEQFEKIRLELENLKKVTYPRTYDWYDIFCVILYLLKEGCFLGVQFHMISQNVRYHYDMWTKLDENGICVLDKILRKFGRGRTKKRKV